jgi:hypothetical protein
VSIFAPTPALLEDINGVNWDVIYESGPVVDKEGDGIKFEVSELSTIFNFELTEQNRVRITMAQQM